MADWLVWGRVNCVSGQYFSRFAIHLSRPSNIPFHHRPLPFPLTSGRRATAYSEHVMVTERQIQTNGANAAKSRGLSHPRNSACIAPVKTITIARWRPSVDSKPPMIANIATPEPCFPLNSPQKPEMTILNANPILRPFSAQRLNRIELIMKDLTQPPAANHASNRQSQF